jgi:DNA-binding NarL/FixJ family response regulator
MDVQMPRVSGPDATRTLLTRQPTVRVLMVSASTSPRVLAESAAAGASGYLLKGGNAHGLVDAVRVVAAGGTAWPDDPARDGIARPVQAPVALQPEAPDDSRAAQ